MPRVQDDAKASLFVPAHLLFQVFLCQSAMIWYSTKQSCMPAIREEITARTDGTIAGEDYSSNGCELFQFPNHEVSALSIEVRSSNRVRSAAMPGATVRSAPLGGRRRRTARRPHVLSCPQQEAGRRTQRRD
ncbi:hypothetical protein SETIT_3G391800v2 [Setaria italica]|uniref:Uncharacterized protein n=1 Tax=Setaria italica TaxID=4555 RepID=A0A368QNG1_SETIT|nr:hypothetical protein SETIT_3G391800v2 [Setaria italica]